MYICFPFCLWHAIGVSNCWIRGNKILFCNTLGNSVMGKTTSKALGFIQVLKQAF